MRMNEMFRIAANAGIRVEYCRLPLNESVSAPDPNGDFILMDYSLLYASRQERVHMAHELGHCSTGSFYNRHTPFDVRQCHENRADKWAIAQLIPRNKLNRALSDGYTKIWSLAEYFNVTEEFMRKAVCWYTYGNLATELYF